MLRRISRAALVLAAALAVSVPIPALARGNPGHGGGGGGRPPNAGTQTVGNNLSYPAVFAEGIGITGLSSTTADSTKEPWQQLWTGLRIPSVTNPTLATGPDGTTTVGSTLYYLQGTEQSSWQAGWINGAGQPAFQTNVKWGDNLLSTLLPSSGGSSPWTTTSTIHIEVGMTSTASTGALPGSTGLEDYFPMTPVSGSGSTATYGTDGKPVSAAGVPADVYSEYAYLTIQQVDAQGVAIGLPVHQLTTWNRAVEGPSTTALTPEVNASGNIDYSYNWFTGRDKLQPGYYKLTFGIAPSAGTLGSPAAGNVSIAEVMAPGATEGEVGTPVSCGTPVTVTDETGKTVTLPITCDSATNSSSIVLQLVSGSTTGGGGGGGGHGGGGGGHGGGGS